MSYLSMYRGDDRTLSITASASLADCEVAFTAKRSKSDADEDAVIRKSTGDGGVEIGTPDTTAVVTIDAADTEDLEAVALYWDVQIVDAAELVRTVASGRLAILADITRTAPAGS